MTPQVFLHTVIVPGAKLLPPELDSPEARCLLLAIAGQESAWSDPLGDPSPGPRGYWRCRKATQVTEVLSADATRQVIRDVCERVKTFPALDQVYAAIGVDPSLAYGVARLLLLLDRSPLPQIGERDEAWRKFQRAWRIPPTGYAETWFIRYEAAAACFERTAAASATG